MPLAKVPRKGLTTASAPAIIQVPGVDPSIWDMDTAIETWTTLVNQTLPNLFNALEYLKGVIDGL